MNEQLTLEQMLHCLRNPKSDRRSVAELDDVIDEIIDRNPDWVDEILGMVEEKK